MNNNSASIYEMNKFIDVIYESIKNNDSYSFTRGSLYHLMCFYNIKTADRRNNISNVAVTGKDVSEMFDYWTQRKAMKNTKVFVQDNWKHFCRFVSNKQINDHKYIKLYIPLDHAHLQHGVDMIFDFLDKGNVAHDSKVSRNVRADNVIVRLGSEDLENANKLINFINSNPYLREGLNKPNPFIPTFGGVGIMNEHGNSYNGDLSDYMYDFMTKCKNQGIPRVTADDFRAYLYDCKKNNYVIVDPNEEKEEGMVYTFDDSLLSTFEQAYFGTNQVEKKPNETEDLEKNQTEIFYQAFKATFDKYGLTQTIEALNRIISHNDFSYVSNGNKNYRTNLMTNLTRENVSSIIMKELSRLGLDPYEMNTNRFAVEYCKRTFAQDYTQVLFDVCRENLAKYPQYQLMKAFEEYLSNDKMDYFTRSSRQALISIPKFLIKGTMQKVLMENGMNPIGISDNDLISAFVYEMGMKMNNQMAK